MRRVEPRRRNRYVQTRSLPRQLPVRGCRFRSTRSTCSRAKFADPCSAAFAAASRAGSACTADASAALLAGGGHLQGSDGAARRDWAEDARRSRSRLRRARFDSPAAAAEDSADPRAGQAGTGCPGDAPADGSAEVLPDVSESSQPASRRWAPCRRWGPRTLRGIAPCQIRTQTAEPDQSAA